MEKIMDTCVVFWEQSKTEQLGTVREVKLGTFVGITQDQNLEQYP